MGDKVIGEDKLIKELGKPPRIEHLLEGLRLYQIELEMQNRELEAVREELQRSRNIYAELYNEAPVGYTSLDEKGVIREMNVTGAAMLGQELGNLIGKPFIVFLPESSREPFITYLQTLEKEQNLKAELEFEGEDDLPRYTELSGVSHGDDDTESLYRIVLNDITERKLGERELRTRAQILRDLSNHLEGVRERERHAIAREVHDQLGQELTAMHMYVDWLRRKLSKDREAQEVAESLTELIDTTIESVEAIALRLRPKVLDEIGLIAATESHINQLKDKMEIEFNLDLDEKIDQLPLRDEIKIAVFRIFQEAITNSIRHSGANIIGVSMRLDGIGLLMDVMDNGRGIRDKEIADAKSLGLTGMKERARDLGGDVEIVGVKGKGTRLMLRIPTEQKRPNGGE
ncbi:MAG: hypothetical protein A2W01_03085 [Candidatus Solincola sediminis]|nr:MAG: hypothetical protein A2W01_03085 [Candidatus Solincola sediminis]